MSTEPRELFPVTFMGPRNGVSKINETINPDGTSSGKTPLDDLPEPTAEELAALEAGEEPEITTPEAGLIPDPPVDDTLDMAGTANTGKGKGAASKA